MLRAVFLLSLVLAAYSCGFDHLQRPPLQFVETGPRAIVEGEGRLLQQTYENIRVYADYSYLASINSTIQDYIQNQIMPSALDYYSATLKIVRLTENLTTSVSCAGYDPPAYLASPGVEADLIVLVVAEDWPDQTFVAAALPCGLSTTNNRPVYGLMLFNLAYLPMEKVTDNQENLSTALHELCHIFGFNSDFYTYYINATTGQTLSGIVGQIIVNGNYVSFIDVEPLTSKVKAYFGCNSLLGAYLEDEGDSGSQGSHWERRIFMNEYMTASSVTEPVISEITLALLEGTGWYQVDYSMAEPFNFGRGEGCSFVDGPCTSSNGTANFIEYCNSNVYEACSFTSRGVGFCGTGPNADYFADGCPYYMSSAAFDCADPTNQATAMISGELFGPTSRCFTGTLVDSIYSASYSAYCFPTSCTQSGSSWVLTLMVGNNNITCSSAGNVSIPGYNGYLYCPDPNKFCNTSNPTWCQKGCSGRGTCVNNVCQCPDGWAGVDCAERFFNATCQRCQNQTGTGCYGDQCIARADILYVDPLMAEEEPGEWTDIGENGEYINEEEAVFEETGEGELGGFEEEEPIDLGEEDLGLGEIEIDIGNTDDNPSTDDGSGSTGETSQNGDDDTNSSNGSGSDDLINKTPGTTSGGSSIDIALNSAFENQKLSGKIIAASTSIAILLTLI